MISNICMQPQLHDRSDFPEHHKRIVPRNGAPPKASVIIMAGGYGTRLGPLTQRVPKPMIPVGNRPVLDHILTHVQNHGFNDVVITLHYLPHIIREHFQNHQRDDLKLQFFEAQEDLGTAGSVRGASLLARHNRLLVLSGDLLTNFDLGMLHRFHRRRKSLMTVALCHVDDARQYGVAHVQENGRIDRFQEKPETTPEGGAWVNAGIYMIEREALNLAPPDKFYDFSRNLIPELMARNIPIYGCKLPGYWYDMGTPQTLLQAEQFLQHKGASIGNRNLANVAAIT
ncbi:nucleotidyltransferase family protein [Candidatus Sumerlaeota bacterium]|nr:nucleotidyltransferase family protein [Candidatus Sumerlaeota bacterium]